MLWGLREELGVEMAGKLQRGGLWRGDGSVLLGETEENFEILDTCCILGVRT